MLWFRLAFFGGVIAKVVVGFELLLNPPVSEAVRQLLENDGGKKSQSNPTATKFA